MIRRLFLTAIMAGFISGSIIAVIYQFTTVPLIHFAETFENKEKNESASVNKTIYSEAAIILVHGAKKYQNNAPWEPENEFQRMFYTTLTTIFTGIGFALLLVSGMVMKNQAVDARRGVLWGACGFLAFTLAPAMGLPPELPGTAAGDIIARQTWWISATIAAIVGLWLLVFSESVIYRTIGSIIIIIPHIIGAPHPEAFSINGPPAEIAAKFVAVSITVSGLFWIFLGGFSGYFFARLDKSTN